ncbi:hypothetical protein [Spirulina sp. 06S082]|uniref:hypothetical protein n=1 Tax=Spirulina sp. 06S082 TaxID=3110248 RepID=UPI002B1FD569|nr:hypothetical protein [Spirulina sp. 06S082]MEA5467989.1 hypothetical protein [Spirulina sp. 06S082]
MHRSSRHKSSPYGWKSTFFCTLGSPTGVEYISVRKYCELNFCSRSQVRTMLRRGQLIGLQRRRSLFVAKNPYYQE